MATGTDGVLRTITAAVSTIPSASIRSGAGRVALAMDSVTRMGIDLVLVLASPGATPTPGIVRSRYWCSPCRSCRAFGMSLCRCGHAPDGVTRLRSAHATSRRASSRGHIRGRRGGAVGADPACRAAVVLDGHREAGAAGGIKQAQQTIPPPKSLDTQAPV